VTVPQTALRSALQCLEKFSGHPDTPAIHDPIYLLLGDENKSHEKAVARALLSNPSHPAVVELRSIFDGHIEWEAPSLASVLEHHGALVESEDLVAEVGRRLDVHKKKERQLRLEIDRIEVKLVQSERAANAVAALGAFALMFALFGWMVALGWIEVQWMEVPVPVTPSMALPVGGSG